MRHDHGPIEWCSQCPHQWLLADVPGYASTTLPALSLQPIIDVLQKGFEDMKRSQTEFGRI